MKKWKEYLLYPAIAACIYSGIIALVDMGRDTLESFRWYALSALIMYAVLAISSYLVGRRRKNK